MTMFQARDESGGGPLSDAAYERAALIRQRLRVFQRGSEETVRAYGLTPQRYLILLLVKARRDPSGGAAVAELARRLQLSETTVEEFAQRAVTDGLLTVNHESQPFAVSLSEQGERQLADATAAVIPLQEQLLRDLADFTNVASQDA